ncbi:MAG: Penicillin-binding protein transpeptidase [bacterium P3]|nr:MAG: Penicillin-binding protein transpeptidase [bacterium P3]KWW40505.1 MAG: Penicillin-binding protein transpeptidase [bacterium F083]
MLRSTVWVYVLLPVVVSACIIGAMVKIQWVDGAEWRERANHRVEMLRVDPAQRGTIYSGDGKILATTVPVCDLYLDMATWVKKDKHGQPVLDRRGAAIIDGPIPDSAFYNSLDSVCRTLHRVVPDRPVSYFRDKLLNARRSSRPNRCFLVQRGIPYSAWMDICQYKGWSRGVLKTVRYEEGERSVLRQERAHVYGNMGKNVIGFKNSNSSDTYTGLEGFYDEKLRGTDGLYRYRRLTRGVWLQDGGGDLSDWGEELTLDSVSKQQRVDGVDIISSIDTRYQDVAETSLRRQLMRYGATSGCAVLMEVATGYILACSSLVLDTQSHTYVESVDNNVACSDLYEPGSIFKPVFLTALFNDKQVPLDTARRVRVGRKVFSQYSGEISDDDDRVDTVSVKRALAVSSNVGMCELAWHYYRDRRSDLEQQVRRVLPYEPLMLDLKTNEPRGTVNRLQSDRGFLNFCYGYNSNVTVLQMLTFYNAIAGGGRMMKPLFCKAVGRDGDYRAVPPVVLNKSICSPETAKQIREMMEEVVQHGTGSNIKNNIYGIAGKTGTSSVYDARAKSYIPDCFYASFAGFFPSEHPKYSCIVVVKNVRAHGRQAAAPVFKNIADCVVSMDKELSHIRFPEVGDSASVSRRPVAVQHRDYPSGQMPDCKGLTVRQAVALLEARGLKVRFDGYGRVRSQSPRAGAVVQRNQQVVIHLQ